MNAHKTFHYNDNVYYYFRFFLFSNRFTFLDLLYVRPCPAKRSPTMEQLAFIV